MINGSAVDDAAVAELLNAAWAEARLLPRVVPQPIEIPPLTAQDVAKRREHGWLGEGLSIRERDGKLTALVDARVTSEMGQIGWFGTHPDYRGQGLATECLQQALGYLAAHGMQFVQTASFVDSRVTSVCDFLEANGLAVRDPEHQNIIMQIDMGTYQALPVTLPEGYSIEPLQMTQLDEWMAVKNRIFGTQGGPEWFMNSFGSRWDFEPQGWLVLRHGETLIGMAGADLHRDPALPECYRGCQIEYVGVCEEHRGHRLGEMLVVSCLNYAKALGVQPLQLATQYFRVPAVRLYERLGFRIVRENRVYEMNL